MTSVHPKDVLVPPRPASVDAYEYAYKHAAPRLLERYGLTIGPLEYTRLCLDLASLRVSQLPRASHRTLPGDRVLLTLRIQGVATRAVWSLRSGVIVSWVPATPDYGDVERTERNWSTRQSRRMRRRYKRHDKHRGGA